MTFAENINRICAERGTNLTTDIKQIKNGQSSYTTAINKRGSIPNQAELLALAEILQCSVMDFFADEEDLAPLAEPKNEDEQDLLHSRTAIEKTKRTNEKSLIRLSIPYMFTMKTMGANGLCLHSICRAITPLS